MSDLNRYWYGSRWQWVTILLLPFTGLFILISNLRRLFYRLGILKIEFLTVPVIVVGNITAGGTGKTPMVIWLAEYLRSLGYRPGIISRGVGGKSHKTPYLVTAETSTDEVGDESVLLAQRTQCPVAVCTQRVKSARYLIEQHQCNVVISDDGLQHYRLDRDIEIAMVDAVRQFGNGYRLPAGPLRESVGRLKRVDFVVTNGGQKGYTMTLVPEPLAIPTGSVIHAVAGIGHPQRFFTLLTAMGYQVIPHIFPDHYRYQQSDLNFADNHPIVMTEKDAVKCVAFTDQCYRSLRVHAKLSDEFVKQFHDRLRSLEVTNEANTNHACHDAVVLESSDTRCE